MAPVQGGIGLHEVGPDEVVHIFDRPGTFDMSIGGHEHDIWWGTVTVTTESGIPAQPAPAPPTQPAQTPTVTVLFNGAPVIFSVPPVERNGFLFYPLEYLLDALFGGHTWDATTNIVWGQRDGNRVEVALNYMSYWVNGVRIDADPRLVPFHQDGRTFVNLDYIVNGLGLNLHWDGATSTISITG